MMTQTQERALPDARMARVVHRVVEHLKQVIVEENISYRELMDGLLFLNEVGAAGEMVLLSDVTKLSTFAERQDAEGQGGTTSNVEGPFWRPGAPRYSSPAELASDDEPGEHICLQGRITDAESGAPVPHAAVDLWQTNASGKYDHEDPALPEWHLRGVIAADGGGHYAVHTVVPTAYTVPTGGPVGRLLAAIGQHPWRPAHIHVRVTAPGYATLTTLIYMADDPWLDDDTIGSVKADLVVAPGETAHGGPRPLRFDISLRPKPKPQASPER